MEKSPNGKNIFKSKHFCREIMDISGRIIFFFSAQAAAPTTRSQISRRKRMDGIFASGVFIRVFLL